MIEDEIIRTNMDTDVVVSSIKSSVHILKGRPKANRNEQKQFWTNGYKIWDNDEFKSHLRLHRQTWNYLNSITKDYFYFTSKIRLYKQNLYSTLPSCASVIKRISRALNKQRDY